MPRKRSENANFAGLDGWRLPQRIHSTEKTGARVRMNIELTDCSQLYGKLKPKSSVRVWFCAKSAKLDPDCSNAVQKRIEKA